MRTVLIEQLKTISASWLVDSVATKQQEGPCFKCQWDYMLPCSLLAWLELLQADRYPWTCMTSSGRCTYWSTIFAKGVRKPDGGHIFTHIQYKAVPCCLHTKWWVWLSTGSGRCECERTVAHGGFSPSWSCFSLWHDSVLSDYWQSLWGTAKAVTSDDAHLWLTDWQQHWKHHIAWVTACPCWRIRVDARHTAHCLSFYIGR